MYARRVPAHAKNGARDIRGLIQQRLARAAVREAKNGGSLPGPGRCGFCGAEGATHHDPLVPRTLRLRWECGRCPRLPGASEEIPSCAACHLHKKGRGLYELFRMRFPFDRRFAERIPPHLEREYLAEISECHDCASTLDQRDIDGDGRLTVFDIDFVLHRR